MRRSPSQLTPPKPWANVAEPMATRYSPASTSSNANVPSVSVVVESTWSPSASRNSTVTPGSPTSSDSTSPGVQNVSLTLEKTALTAPRSGSCWYIAARQMTPAAKSEIAMGMNTTVLKATDQLIRSVMTAKMSPIAVTRAGTTPTQIALFLIAVTVFGSLKSFE